ncbi:MAG: hypothetical protein B7Y45_00635 [Sphingomonas sp. 28-66-16]|nr:MAG: hypothetical protein B7Y45_00635 [Sphingomonas sp. 28-66-16]
MDAIALDPGGYVSINNRRRALAFAGVAAVYLAIILIFIGIRERAPQRLVREAPMTITLLPLDPPEKPAPARDLAIEKPRPQRPAPPAPPVAKALPRPAPPPPAPQRAMPAVPPPLPAPPPPAAAAGPIRAGEGDAVYDLDSGAGGGQPGSVPPRWLRKVTNDEFFPLVDEDLLQASLEVDYRMECTISLDTRVKCRVLREVPFYPGLRRAVLAAVPMLRMAPGKRDGRPIDQQKVEFLWRITVDRGDIRLR